MVSVSSWRNAPTAHTRFDPARQRRAWLLHLLLLIVGFGLVALTIFSNLNTMSQPNLKILWPEVIGLVVVVFCYTLNKLGYTNPASLIFFIAANLVITWYIADRSDRTILMNLRGISPILAIPVVAAGVIIGPIYSFVFAAISVVSVVAIGLLRASPTVTAMETPLAALSELSVPVCFLFVMAGLAWVFETNFQSLIAQLTDQNRLLASTNQELARKREIEQHLNRRVDELTGQVSSAFEVQSYNSNEQLAAVVMVTTTIEQLSRINTAMLEAVNQVDSTAQKALGVVEIGTATLRNGLNSLTVLTNQTRDTAAAMQELYSQARQINQIIELITEIAEETSLLALNATIEAAGAGQYGRRFAAVAGEVQRLANRSHHATEQVQQVVDEVSKALEKSSSIVKRGVQEAGQVMSGTRSMEQTLEEIVAMVNSTATLARQISLSIQQQKDATNQVVETMHYISDLSHSVASGSKSVMESLDNLNGAVAELNSVASTPAS